MVSFTVVTQEHPAALYYFEELKDNLSGVGIYKGDVSIKKKGKSLHVSVDMRNYIPKFFLWLGALSWIGSLILFFFDRHVLGWLTFIPGIVLLLFYYFFQSETFYYHSIRLALRKRGYKGVVVLRTGE